MSLQATAVGPRWSDRRSHRLSATHTEQQAKLARRQGYDSGYCASKVTMSFKTSILRPAALRAVLMDLLPFPARTMLKARRRTSAMF